MKTYVTRTAISDTDRYIEANKRVTEAELKGLNVGYLISRRALVPDGKTVRKIDLKTATREELIKYIEERREAEKEADKIKRLGDAIPETRFFPLDTGADPKAVSHPSIGQKEQRGSKAPDYRSHPGIDDDDSDDDGGDTDTEKATAAAAADAGEKLGVDISAIVRKELAAALAEFTAPKS